jgi:hypothetical protein
LNELLAATGHETECGKRNQIEEQDANVVNGYSAVVNDIKTFRSEPEPAGVKLKEPCAA